MPLIKSISGIRGTIGGRPGENLTPLDIVVSTAAFGQLVKEKTGKSLIVVGRDARISGAMVNSIVIQTLVSMGIDVVDLGLSTTPTVEMAVPEEKAGGGIIITASHNPREWNALKFLDQNGEFISAGDGQRLLEVIEQEAYAFVGVDQLGAVRHAEGYIQRHIDKIFALPLVQSNVIREKRYRIVVDCINSTGALSVVPLLEQLNCEVAVINGVANGQFAHNPEPLPEHLNDLAKAVREEKADLGISVDPDVDRLALVCENGEMFGEEYTLVAVADYILQQKPGNTVSNLSSTRALSDITRKYGAEYFPSAVGEVNVVAKMKAVNAVIGGEGNGGIIYPALHYGRDALVGVAFILSYLATTGLKASELRDMLPPYAMTKGKIALPPSTLLDQVLDRLAEEYKFYPLNREDGLKIEFPNGWVHLRKSNTEPIIRIYSEGIIVEKARQFADKVRTSVEQIVS